MIIIIITNMYTWYNLIQPDVDIVISICTGLLMVKSQGME